MTIITKHSRPPRMTFRSRPLPLLLGLLLGGCGGNGDVATTVRRPAGQRPDLQPPAPSGTTTIPASQAFNITSFKSGQEGNARGGAESSGRDGAQCRAEASDGGNAWGEFQLGYCFDNATGVPLQAAVKISMTVVASQTSSPAEQAAADTKPHPQSSPPPAAPANASAALGANLHLAGGQPGSSTTVLKYFVKDSNGALLRQETLLSTDLERGPQDAKDAPKRFFDIRFEPDRGYYIVIAGRTEVRAGPGQTASAKLDVLQCDLELTWQPRSAAPPVADAPVAPTTGTNTRD